MVIKVGRVKMIALAVSADRFNILNIYIYEKGPFFARWIRIDIPEGTLDPYQIIVSIV